MRLTPTTAVLLVTPPLMWAGNAVVGRMVVDLVPPMMLNFLRWAVAFVLLLPLAPWVLRRDSPIWPGWRRYALLGLLGVGCYNSLQYLALHTSTPMNVVLVASTLPLWMLVLGRAFFGASIRRTQLAGMGLSIAGVLVVLTGGQWQQLLHWHLVPGDVLMLVATILWAWYSWLLLPQPGESERLRADWAALLLAQVTYGVGWSALFAAGEWAWVGTPTRWGWPLAATLAFVAIGPAVIAYRCWGLGVQRGGPALAGVFYNLAPVFAAILSALFLGEWPRPFHGVAFALIALGIWASSRR